MRTKGVVYNSVITEEGPNFKKLLPMSNAVENLVRMRIKK